MKFIARSLVALFCAFGIMTAADTVHADEASSEEAISYGVDLGILYGCEETTASLQAFPNDGRLDALQVSLSGGTIKEILPTDGPVVLTAEEVALLGSAPSGTFSVSGGEPVSVNVLTSFVSDKGCLFSIPHFSMVRFCPENGVLLINDGNSDVTVLANDDKFIMVSGEQRTVSYDSAYELHVQAFGPDTESLVDTVVTLDVEHCGGRQPSATFVGVMSCLGYTDGTLTLTRDGVPGIFHFSFPERGGEMTDDVMTFEDISEVNPTITAPDGSDVPVTIDLYKEECEVAEPPIPPSTEPPASEPVLPVRGTPIQVTDTVPPPPLPTEMSNPATATLPATGSGVMRVTALASATVLAGVGARRLARRRHNIEA